MTFERTEVLKSFDGNDIFFRCFTPKKAEAKIEGLVVAVHGFGEHSGRYAEVAAKVCEKGFAFAAFDLRGHGKSGPARGDAENMHAIVLDVLFIVNHARAILGLSSQAPLGILGHSFGALILTYAAAILGNTCPPLFFSSPLYQVKDKVRGWKRAAARTLPQFAPLVPIPTGIRPETLSENPANNSAYMADELNLFSVSARMGSIVLQCLEDARLRNAASLIKAPVTIVCAGKDTLTDGEHVKNIMPSFAPGVAKLEYLTEAGHEIFNEKEPAKAEAFKRLSAWIDTLKAHP